MFCFMSFKNFYFRVDLSQLLLLHMTAISASILTALHRSLLYYCPKWVLIQSTPQSSLSIFALTKTCYTLNDEII